MPLQQIHDLVKEELKAADRLIQEQLESKVHLIRELGSYITQNGGKKLRPLLVLLGAGLFNHQNHPSIIKLAAMIEMFHTATLLHDDVVDASTMRRGKETANAIWGNQASVLVGDFLYARTFQMMTSLKNFPLFEILTNATAVIAEGETLQLQNCHNPDVTEEAYMKVIEYKTGVLFAVAAQMGAVLSNASQEELHAVETYGLRLGTAFQIIDDTLDYCANPEETGKNLGDDLMEGKPTLPLIHAMRTGTAEEKALIRDAITHGKQEQLEVILQAIRSTKAIDYAYAAAKRETDAALAALAIFPDSKYRDALKALVNFAVNRSY